LIINVLSVVVLIPLESSFNTFIFF